MPGAGERVQPEPKKASPPGGNADLAAAPAAAPGRPPPAHLCSTGTLCRLGTARTRKDGTPAGLGHSWPGEKHRAGRAGMVIAGNRGLQGSGFGVPGWAQRTSGARRVQLGPGPIPRVSAQPGPRRGEPAQDGGVTAGLLQPLLRPIPEGPGQFGLNSPARSLDGITGTLLSCKSSCDSRAGRKISLGLRYIGTVNVCVPGVPDCIPGRLGWDQQD